MAKSQQKLNTTLPQHPKRNADHKKVTVATAKGSTRAGHPHLAKHAVGKLGNNKSVC